MPHHNKRVSIIRSQKGFTLMEILVVMFVLGLVMSGLFATLNWNFKTSFDGVSRQRELENFRVFNNNIVEDIQLAKSITINNQSNKDTLQYVTIDNRVNIFYFESDGLYKQMGSQKIKVASGSKYEENVPAVYFENSGLVKFNFYAENAKALLYVAVKPIIFKPN